MDKKIIIKRKKINKSKFSKFSNRKQKIKKFQIGISYIKKDCFILQNLQINKNKNSMLRLNNNPKKL